MTHLNAFAHRPAIAPRQQYVQWTEHHQAVAAGLPPCAVHLWQYLLYKYPGGVPQEIDLEELRFEISQGRSKPYCVQSLKNALWNHLIPQGLVSVIRQFTRRIFRVVARHAGPIKEIAKNFSFSQKNWSETKKNCESGAETLIPPSSIQSVSEDNTTRENQDGGFVDEVEEIRAAIAQAPFMQEDDLECGDKKLSQPSTTQISHDAPRNIPNRVDLISQAAASLARMEHPGNNVPSPPDDANNEPIKEPVNTQNPTPEPDSAPFSIEERLRNLHIPLTQEVRAILAKSDNGQMERNISALEEENARTGLKSPIAAFKYFVANNCQPRMSDRVTWWNKAGVALGKENRDRIIQAVFEYAGEAVVLFTSGRSVPFAQVQNMSWEQIAAS